jgi:hypothetical protein
MPALDCLRQKAAQGCAWPLESLLRGRTFPRTGAKRLPSGVSVLDLNTRVCPQGQCRAAVDGWPMMFNEHQFTATFSRRLRPISPPNSAPQRMARTSAISDQGLKP